MVKMTNDKFDKILEKRADERKQNKAKNEARRQVKIDSYYDDYYRRVELEKKNLYVNNKVSILNVFVLLIIIILAVLLILYFCFPDESRIILSYFLH